MQNIKFLFLALSFTLAIASCSSASKLATTPTPDPTSTLIDTDFDGVADDTDCAPNDATIAQGLLEILADGIDQDCTGSDKFLLKSITQDDTNADGTPEQTTTFIYNNLGKITKMTTEAGGAINSVMESTYDDNGNKTEETSDNLGDGTIEVRSRWAYDPQGNPLSQKRDYFDDGTIDDEEQFEYNAEGKKTKVTRLALGVIKSRSTYVYDASGELLETYYEKLSPLPLFNQKSVYVRDAAGNSIRNEYYEGTPYVLKSITDNTFDAAGNMLSSAEDHDNNGDYERIRYFEYDADGQTTKSTQDGGSGMGDANGSIDFIAIYTYEDLGDGKIKGIMTADENADGTPDSIEYQISNSAKEISYGFGRDHNGDGIMEEESKFEYDAFGQMILFINDSPADGTPDYIKTVEHFYSE